MIYEDLPPRKADAIRAETRWSSALQESMGVAESLGGIRPSVTITLNTLEKAVGGRVLPRTTRRTTSKAMTVHIRISYFEELSP